MNAATGLLLPFSVLSEMKPSHATRPLKVPEAVAEGPQRQHPSQLQGEERVQRAPHHR
jgi:hypothetical protein